eukprot:scaffold180397_cov25-Tisochrysis_lutea.AAC.1
MEASRLEILLHVGCHAHTLPAYTPLSGLRFSQPAVSAGQPTGEGPPSSRLASGATSPAAA